MLSTYIRTAQSLELALYAVLAWALGLGPAAAVLAVAIAFLGARAIFVATGFALAWLHRSPGAAEHRLPPPQAVALFAREYRWLLAFNLLYVPWDRFFVRRDPEPRAGEGTPIVLVHGYFANRGYFRPLVRRLEAEGLGPVFTPNLRSFHAPIERFESELSAHLQRVSAGCGKRAIVIAHSMGGLGVRAHLASHGNRYVERIVTIASPHHGTVLALHSTGAAPRQMRPGSEFLRDLAAREGEGPRIRALSIYSMHDNLVAPPETSRLPWARNVALARLGHLETVHAQETFALVLAELRGT
jgi:triacylglycerol lipase